MRKRPHTLYAAMTDLRRTWAIFLGEYRRAVGLPRTLDAFRVFWIRHEAAIVSIASAVVILAIFVGLWIEGAIP